MSIFMGGEQYPYTNFHDLNLDWILKTVKEILNKFDEAISSKIKFADPIDWDITKQYEALTLVMNDDNAYISMQPVPAGIDITNEEYWQKVFDMSDFEQTFYDQLDDLESEIDDVRSDLGEDVTELNNKLGTKVGDLSTRHVLLVGDSYMFWGDGLLPTTFISHCGTPANQIHNVAVSGSSFHDGTFLQQITDYTGDKTEITDIIIAGGINDAIMDFNSYTTYFPNQTVVTDAIDLFASYVAQNYPNAKMHFAYIGGCMASSQYYSNTHPRKPQEIAHFIYTNYCQKYGDIYDVSDIIHITSDYYGSDGLHPSNDGATVIGDALAEAYKGNHVESSRPWINKPQTASGLTSNTQCTVDITIKKGVATLSFNPFYLEITSGSVINNTFKEVMTINPKVKTPIYIPVLCNMIRFNNQASYIQRFGTIKLEDGKMYLSVSYPASEWSYTDYTANSGAVINVGSFTVSIPVFEMN